jgi:hypothetical protein
MAAGARPRLSIARARAELALECWLAAVVIGCSSDGASVAPGSSDTQVAGSGTLACPAVDDDAQIVVTPEFWTAFHNLSSPCETLGASVLLQNVGTNAVSVDGMSVDTPGLSLDVAELPKELQTGEFLPIRFRFRSNEAGPVEGTVTVATSDGCRRFRTYGLAVSGPTLSRSDEAIDFGGVPQGATVTRRLTLLLQSSDSDPVSRLSSYSASEAFELVSAPAEGPLESCTPSYVELRFHAPAATGPIAGLLSWEANSIVGDREFVGFAFVTLHGATVEAPPSL